MTDIQDENTGDKIEDQSPALPNLTTATAFTLLSCMTGKMALHITHH